MMASGIGILMRESCEFQFAAHVESGKMVCYVYPPSLDVGKLATLLSLSSHGTKGAWQFLSDLEGFPLIVCDGGLEYAIKKLDEKLYPTIMSHERPAFDAYTGRVQDIWMHLEEGGGIDEVIAPVLPRLDPNVQPELLAL